ncbi:MAG: GNAT family N-acetyltransferase [Caldilineaceae bacterium]
MATTIVELAQAALGVTSATPMDTGFWQWKHHANPFGDSYGLYAWDAAKAQAVGARILMRWQFCDGAGTPYRAVRAVDTTTHPDYQRQGIFSRLTRQAIAELREDGVDLIFNTPNQKSLPGYLKLGWQQVTRWPLYLKPLRPLRMAARRMAAAAVPSPDRFDAYFDDQILRWPSFIARYGDQVEEVLAANDQRRLPVGLRTPRSIDYLAWRYGQHPAVQYGIFAETDSQGRLSGFAVLRPNVRYGWQEVVLTELLLAEPVVRQGGRLLRNLGYHLRGDYLIAHFAEGTVAHTSLRRSGFWRVPRQGMIFTVYPLQPDREVLVQPSRWDLALGDLELF